MEYGFAEKEDRLPALAAELVDARVNPPRRSFSAPVDPLLKALVDEILASELWELKLLGMQMLIEGLASPRRDCMTPLDRDAIESGVPKFRAFRHLHLVRSSCRDFSHSFLNR